jgi:hypothetical protein
MSKDRKPRKRRSPADNESAEGEKEVERQTEEKAELVPPVRRPPTAVGAETPPPPPPLPPARRQRVPERQRPAFSQLVQALRLAVGAIIDLADAAADAITKRIEGKA